MRRKKVKGQLVGADIRKRYGLSVGMWNRMWERGIFENTNVKYETRLVPFWDEKDEYRVVEAIVEDRRLAAEKIRNRKMKGEN